MTKDKWQKAVLCVVILLYTLTDGWRDAWLSQDWWPRHIAKWLAWYPLPLYMLWDKGYLNLRSWRFLLWLSAGGYFFWELAYKLMS